VTAPDSGTRPTGGAGTGTGNGGSGTGPAGGAGTGPKLRPTLAWWPDAMSAIVIAALPVALFAALLISA